MSKITSVRYNLISLPCLVHKYVPLLSEHHLSTSNNKTARWDER